MNIKNMSKQVFLDTYSMKEELQAFCKEEGLQSTGSKLDLTAIIAHYLETGEKIKIKKAKVRKEDTLTLDSIIGSPITYSEAKRAFFKQYLGDGFHFAVPFQRWLKANTGKTYRDAIEAFPQVMANKKQHKESIDKQFEYNTYIRAFFADNKGKTLQDAILCWKYKKRKQGSHAYDSSDLMALKKK